MTAHNQLDIELFHVILHQIEADIFRNAASILSRPESWYWCWFQYPKCVRMNLLSYDDIIRIGKKSKPTHHTVKYLHNKCILREALLLINWNIAIGIPFQAQLHVRPKQITSDGIRLWVEKSIRYLQLFVSLFSTACTQFKRPDKNVRYSLRYFFLCSVIKFASPHWFPPICF